MVELLQNRTIVQISGNEAANFLQTLTTNDILNKKYSFNYLLSPQGKYLFDFFVIKSSDDDLLIDIDSRSAADFAKKLNLYKLRRKIDIIDQHNKYVCLYSHAQFNKKGVIAIYQDPRLQKLGFRIILDRNESADLAYTPGLYFQDKYQFIIPDGRLDLVYDQSLPFHYGGEELSAFSYTKGCYVGQEVISRAKYQGQLRKKIFGAIAHDLTANLALFHNGDDINDINGQKIGSFCSGYNNLGIIILNEEKYLGLSQKTAIINSIDGKRQQIKIIVPEWRL